MNNDKRMIALLRALLGSPAKTRDIAWSAQVSTRTIARDVDRLTRVGVPIYTQPGRGGGLVLALGSRKSRAAFGKLLDSFEQGQMDGSLLGALAQCFHRRIDPRTSEDTQAGVLRAVHDALLDKGCVHLDHFGMNMRIRRGAHRPTRIELHNGEWAFTARPVMGGATQPYRISKVTGAVPCRPIAPQANPPLPDDSACRDVQFLFPGTMALQLTDVFDPAIMEETDSGQVLVRPESDEDRWQIGYFLACMVPIQVIGPEKLRCRAIKEAITAYGRVAPRCRVTGFLPLGTVLPDRF